MQNIFHVPSSSEKKVLEVFESVLHGPLELQMVKAQQYEGETTRLIWRNGGLFDSLTLTSLVNTIKKIDIDPIFFLWGL